MSFTNEFKKYNLTKNNVFHLINVNDNNYVYPNIKGRNKLINIFNNLFTRQNDEIKALSTKIKDISKQFAEYLNTTTIHKLQNCKH